MAEKAIERLPEATTTPLVVEVPEAEPVVGAIRRHVGAFNSGDVDALIAGFALDAFWATGTSVARGHTELRALFTAAIAHLRRR